MENYSFRIFVIIGVIISIVVSKVNKFIGGIVGLLVTTGILIYGLNVYSKPGWTLTFFNIEISQGIFLVLIAVWYFFDIRQIIAGKKEGDVVRDLRTQAGEKLRSGIAPKDVVNQLALTMQIADETTKDMVGHILGKKEYKQTITEQMENKQLDIGKTVLHYKTAIDVLNNLQNIVLGEAKQHNIPIRENELSPFPMPAVKVLKAKAISMTKKLNKNDLIVAYNNKLVTTLEELQAESSQVSSEDKVDLRALFLDPNTGLWTPKKMEIKGGRLELEAEP
jgi:hypothetical protein